MFEQEIRNAIISGQSHLVVHQSPHPTALEKMAAEATAWGLNITIIGCWYAQLDSHNDRWKKGCPAKEIIWHRIDMPVTSRYSYNDGTHSIWVNPEKRDQGVIYSHEAA